MDPEMFVQKIFLKRDFYKEKVSFYGSPIFCPFCKLSQGEDKIAQASKKRYLAKYSQCFFTVDVCLYLMFCKSCRSLSGPWFISQENLA
jgi:hypothetical protein